MGDGARTLKTLYNDLIANPFFPMLFIAETVKHVVLGGPWEMFAALSGVATLLWLLSDAVDIEYTGLEIVSSDEDDDG